ncbi:MAG: sigma-54-dependent Fis family transcriptional regulator [Anderseniella sp.]|nr:sigma-54-dependent Fis family transcriptional regulator [Anderseniella sp.]
MPKTKQKVLLVEDAFSLAVVYKDWLEKSGFDCQHVDTGKAALAALEEGKFQAMVLDLNLPDANGIAILNHVTEQKMPVTVVVVTGSGSIKTAVDAMRAGAYDFIVKPVAEERIITTVRNACEREQLHEAIAEIRNDFADGNFHGFIGKSPVMLGVFKMIENVARSKATAFITGESGTGKEVCAEAIHKSGPRAGKSFVALNCAAIPRDLIESEIFGHVKGAFTGANGDREGAAAAANGGTLFLDEICEMDIDLQTKLLRFLQTGTVQRVGSDAVMSVDVRVICATNRDPYEEVEQGRFREDLYYRLHVLPIHLPPLRDRDADVLEIAQVFLETFAQEEGKPFTGFSVQAEDKLLAHGWPGNVRELQNVIRNAIVLNDGEVLDADMIRLGAPGRSSSLPKQDTTPLSPGVFRETAGQAASVPSAVVGDRNKMVRVMLGRTFAELERDVVMATFDYCGGSVPKASKVLKMSPSTLYRKREEWTRDDP